MFENMPKSRIIERRYGTEGKGKGKGGDNRRRSAQIARDQSCELRRDAKYRAALRFQLYPSRRNSWDEDLIRITEIPDSLRDSGPAKHPIPG